MGGQAGAWDSSRQPGYTHTNGLSATHGGHGGGDAGEEGGTTPCNDMAKGGGGGTQEEPGVGGESNWGKKCLPGTLLVGDLNMPGLRVLDLDGNRILKGERERECVCVCVDIENE